MTEAEWKTRYNVEFFAVALNRLGTLTKEQINQLKKQYQKYLKEHTNG